MPTRYEDLNQAHCDANAKLDSFRERGKKFVLELLTALQRYMGCTDEQLRLRRPEPEDFKTPGREFIAPGLALTKEGLVAQFHVVLPRNEGGLLECVFHPNGDSFRVKMPSETFKITPGDTAAIETWCQAMHQHFLSVAKMTYPFDVRSGISLSDWQV